MVKRLVNPSKNNSFFLFGARGTGKSTFIKGTFVRSKKVLEIDLLNSDLEDEYTRSPMALYEKIRLEKKDGTGFLSMKFKKSRAY